MNEGAVEREREKGQRQGYERSLVIDMPDITVTLLIQRDTNTDEAQASEQKHRRGGAGGARAGDSVVTGFPLPSNSRFTHILLDNRCHNLWFFSKGEAQN